MISSILLNCVWCWRYSLFTHMFLMHVYATYGVEVQVDIVTCRLWLFLYMEKVCWPWWHEVKGMSCWQIFIAHSYASVVVAWWCLEELHIWSHVYDIGKIDATLSYLPNDVLLLGDEDAHVVIIMSVYVVVAKWLCCRCTFGAWWFLMIIMVFLQNIFHCWNHYGCHVCFLM